MNNKSRIRSSDLYSKYLEWCKKESVKTVAKSNKFGAVIHRLFKSENKQYHVDGKATYFYDNIQYVDETICQDFCQRINMPEACHAAD